jgi:N-acetylneuraminic acid mutarotase
MDRAGALLILALVAGCGGGGANALPDAGGASDSGGNSETGTGLGRWDTLPAMPDPARYYLGAAAVRNTIYVIGGNAGPNAAVFQAFDTTTGTWQTLPSLPTQFEMATIAAVGDRLFILGALSTTTTLEFDGQGHWLPRAVMPLAGGRGAAAVGVWGTKIVLAGGVIPGLSNNGLRTGVRQVDVVAYDTATDSWQMLAPMPVAVGYAMGAVLGDRFWVMGGSTNDERTNAVHVLDLAANQWHDVPPTDRTLSNAAVGVVAGRMYVMGGIASVTGMVSPETLIFDDGTSALIALAPMLTPRFAAAAASLGGRIYIAGGEIVVSATDIHPVTTFEVFTP